MSYIKKLVKRSGGSSQFIEIKHARQLTCYAVPISGSVDNQIHVEDTFFFDPLSNNGFTGNEECTRG
jgi:hypothetical protein